MATSKTPSCYQDGIRFQDGTLQTTASGPAVDLQTNGSDNSVQNLLNLSEGAAITLSEAAGTVTVDVTQHVFVGEEPGSSFGAGASGNKSETFTSGADNMYMVTAYIGVTSAGGVGATITASLSWNDGVAKTLNLTSVPIDATSTSSYISFNVPVFIPSGQAVSFSLTSVSVAQYSYGFVVFGL